MGVNYTQIAEALEQEAIAERRKAKQAVRLFCAAEQLELSDDMERRRPTAEWQTEIGDEPSCLAARARAADLLVLGRFGEDGTVATDVLEACLMTTGRPMVIASAKADYHAAGLSHRTSLPAKLREVPSPGGLRRSHRQNDAGSLADGGPVAVCARIRSRKSASERTAPADMQVDLPWR
jgi:hypothetical protein